MKCPECGEELQPGVRVCPNCDYELTDSEFAAAGGAAMPEAPAAPEQPVAPARPAKPTKPAMRGKPEVNMPESILSHGDVNVASNHAEDNSTHDDHSVNTHVQQNMQHNVTDNSQTVNNTTILIMGGGNAPLPPNIDPNTAEAVRRAQAQQDQQAPAQPANNEKSLGSLAGGAAYTPSYGGGSAKKWIILAVIGVIIGGAVYLFFGKKETPAAAPAAQETTVQPVTAPAPAKAAAQPASARKNKEAAAANTPAPQKAATPAPRDANYEAGMKAYNAGDGLAAVQAFKASGSKESLRMLGKIYDEGCGSVEANAMMARKYYKQAENK